MTTKKMLSDWFDEGVKYNKDFMIIICDTYDWEDYPAYCFAKTFDATYKEYKIANMQEIMEVYDLSMDKESQLKEGRAHHGPNGE
jgi:hypothetical protein